jgi:hypothetical protein
MIVPSIIQHTACQYFVTWLYCSVAAIDSSLMSCALVFMWLQSWGRQVFWCRDKVEAAATGLTAGSVSSFSTFCHKNRGNVTEENIIRERLYCDDLLIGYADPCCEKTQSYSDKMQRWSLTRVLTIIIVIIIIITMKPHFFLLWRS